MRLKFKIIIWFFVVLLAVFLLSGILLSIYAPRIIEQQIQQNLKLKASISKVSLTLPFTITLEKLEIGGFVSIRKVSLSPNLIGLLFGKVIIHGLNIVEPVVNLVQSADGKLNLPDFGTKEDFAQKKETVAQKKEAPAFYLTSLNVENGKIIFTDRKVSAEGFQVVVDKLNVKVAKVFLPLTSLATNFKITAELLNTKGNSFGNLEFSGWLDYLAKDMDADLAVKNLDITNFAPYYGDFISKRKLLKAILDSDSKFKAKNNALQINTNLKLSGLVYEQVQEEVQPAELELMKDTLDFFTDENGNLNLEFSINTRLDQPSLNPDELKKIILKAAMKNLAHQSPQNLVNKVANAIEKYKDIGKELKNIFGSK